MKKLPAAMFVALLIVGCGEETLNAQTSKNEDGLSIDLDDNETLERIIAEAIDDIKLLQKGKEGEELRYAPNQHTPFSGWSKQKYENGKIKFLGAFKGGKREGLSTSWYENGNKKAVKNFKDGKAMSQISWKPNGEKCPHTNVKDGKGVVILYHEDGTELARSTFKGGKQNGLMTGWYPDGQKNVEANYKDGKLDGFCMQWHKNGQKMEEANYKDGKREGLMTSWHPNGQKDSEQTHKDGKQDGPSIGWFENGKKRVEVNYKDGQQQGIRRNWYENGKKKSEYTFKQGKLITATAWKINGERCIETDVVEGDGVGVFYGNDGVEKGQSTYKAGSKVSMAFYVYHPNGQKRSETFYSKGMFDGPKTYTSWNENGEKSSEMNYLGNKKHGSHTFWNTNGKKSAFYNYKNDNLDGLMMLWYKNGQQSSETHYKDGKPDGLSKRWYRDGEKWEKSTWVGGKLIAAVVWKPNGEKCPETKIDQKGNGVVVWYQGVGGKERSRAIYKEGFRINEFKKKEKTEEHPNPPTSEYLPVPKHITGLAPIKRQRKIMKYDDGQTMWEEWWDDGTIVSARAWLPNGQQCPDTNVVNGNGVVFWYHENEKKRRRYTYKASKQDGLITHWHENGQKKTEVSYREGKQDGPVIGWNNNGQKRWESTFKAGKEDGLETWWYSTGQKKWEGNYKEGKLWTAIGWKPNGEICPITNVKDGNGIAVWYREDGTEEGRETYKDGIKVR